MQSAPRATRAARGGFSIIFSRSFVALGFSRDKHEIIRAISKRMFSLNIFLSPSLGRPPPKVTWWRDNVELISSVSHPSADGASAVVNQLFIGTVTRDFYGSRLECRAQGSKLLPPVVKEITVQVHCEFLAHICVIVISQQNAAESAVALINKTFQFFLFSSYRSFLFRFAPQWNQLKWKSLHQTNC